MSPDPLAPARGCILGLALAGLFWLAVFALIGCEPQTGGSVQLPPAQYQRDTSAAVHFRDRMEIERICSERVGHYSQACADIGGMNIWIENPCNVADQHWYPALLCHEIGHRNGWPADHRS